MNTEYIDLVVRSRPVLLEILSDRGYDVESYKNVSPEEIYELTIKSQDLLLIKANKSESSTNSMNAVRVVYWIEGAIRHKVESELNKLFDTEENPDPVDLKNEELIVILSEPHHDIFHIQAAKQWLMKKIRVSFFHLKNLISNPAKHEFVPPHKKLSSDEVTALFNGLHLKSTSELPHIKYHVDMQARILGLVPGDVVEIKRPSETCGEYVYYRKCVV